MWEYVEFLKQPILVANIQQYFGVRRKDSITNGSIKTSEASVKTNDNTSTTGKVSKGYVIDNYFWYYLFIVGTALGDEIFYASFIPFWFWNIDGAVGRRFVFVWTIVMYIGQGIKEVVKWPRPSHPAIRMQKKWSEEYGMPSTHAMVGLAIPFSLILFTVDRYIYSIPLGVTAAGLWCTVICISRLYLGMHTVVDIIAGLLLSVTLMIPMVPLVDSIDNILVTKIWSPCVILAGSMLATKYFPQGPVWTPTRNDTTMITSVWAGIYVGSWINFQAGNMTQHPVPPPYAILWPDYFMLGLGALRTFLGFVLVLLSRSATKKFSSPILSFLLRAAPTVPDNYKSFISLSTYYITYFAIGINTVFFIPVVFRFLKIERPTFYTEL